MEEIAGQPFDELSIKLIAFGGQAIEFDWISRPGPDELAKREAVEAELAKRKAVVACYAVGERSEILVELGEVGGGGCYRRRD